MLIRFFCLIGHAIIRHRYRAIREAYRKACQARGDADAFTFTVDYPVPVRCGNECPRAACNGENWCDLKPGHEGGCMCYLCECERAPLRTSAAPPTGTPRA